MFEQHITLFQISFDHSQHKKTNLDVLEELMNKDS